MCVPPMVHHLVVIGVPGFSVVLAAAGYPAKSALKWVEHSPLTESAQGSGPLVFESEAMSGVARRCAPCRKGPASAV